MPYKSKAQARFMHAKHPEIAKRWDAEGYRSKGLPEKKSKGKKDEKPKKKGWDKHVWL